MTPGLALVLVACLLAAASDLRTRRIPNTLVIGLFVCGLAANTAAGWQHALFDLAIVLLVLAVGTFAFSFKLIGGGDVKLVAAAAGTLGFPAAGAFILYTLLCGGVFGLAYSAMRGRLGSTVANLRAIALPIFAGAAPARLQTGMAMPYALAIFAGACLTAIARGFPPHLRLSW
jgi:prepilin peptidase CpaA